MPSASSTTLRGTLELVPNPCTTRPCIPGLALAVVVDGVPYFLTENEALCMHDRDWGRELPAPGKPVAVTGELQTRLDVNDCRFLTIEVAGVRDK